MRLVILSRRLRTCLKGTSRAEAFFSQDFNVCHIIHLKRSKDEYRLSPTEKKPITCTVVVPGFFHGFWGPMALRGP